MLRWDMTELVSCETRRLWPSSVYCSTIRLQVLWKSQGNPIQKSLSQEPSEYETEILATQLWLSVSEFEVYVMQTSYKGTTDSFLGDFVCTSWRTYWHWDRFLSSSFLPIISLLLHNYLSSPTIRAINSDQSAHCHIFNVRGQSIIS
jgi:hypothetical protein